MRRKILVLGGGPCGLSAAWELAGQGCDVTVIEKDNKVGGLCVTHEYKGFRFDLGGHRFISKNKALVDRVRAIMGDELLIANRKSVILHKGKVFSYPLTIDDILFKMGLWQNLKIGVSYTKSLFCRCFFRGKEVSLEDWLINRFGRTLYRIFFGPYTEKLWGLPPGRISSDWAPQRISLLHLGDAVLQLLRLKRGFLRTYTTKFWYPKNGIGQMFDAISGEITRMGGDVILSATVVGITVSGAFAYGVTYLHEGVKKTMRCDAIISTIPLPDLVKAFPVERAGHSVQCAETLGFRAIRFLNILVDMPDISENTWMYVSERRHIMTRIQEPKRRSPFNAPEGKTSIILEIPCNENDAIWNCSQEQLLGQCVADLKELGIDIEGRVIDCFITGVTHGYPVYGLNYEAHRSEILRFLSSYKNIITCGRQGAFQYVFMDRAMEMGMEAARCLTSNIEQGITNVDG